MKKAIFYLNAIILLISCDAVNTDSCHKIITVINNTNKSIYVDYGGGFPETDFRKLIGNPLVSGASKTEANKSNKYGIGNNGECFEYTFPRLESGLMMVFVFDGPTLEEKGWDYIKVNNLVLKRYDLTLEDLRNMNWTIIYDEN
ncbi:MAG: hypothetical protein ACI7YS_07975 [Flavobacterium sp.]